MNLLFKKFPNYIIEKIIYLFALSILIIFLLYNILPYIIFTGLYGIIIWGAENKNILVLLLLFIMLRYVLLNEIKKGRN